VIHFLIMPYRPTARTEARKAATRERIVAAALARVAGGGYRSANVQAVASEAGVAVGTLYRHFPSKASLFAEVFRLAAQRELYVVAEIAGSEGPAAERIASAAEAFCRRALAAPVLAYAQLAEPVDPAVEAERLALRRGYRDVFAHVLEEGVASGELWPHDARTVAAALVGGLGEALVGPLSAPPATRERPRHEALIATLVSFCLDALPREEESHAFARAHA
jgi:AcrR family transcriptional regulator